MTKESARPRKAAAQDQFTAAKVSAALYRMAQGNLSSVKPVGKGVSE